MIEIKKINKKSDLKKFTDFSINMYKNCKNYVPPIYMDEINMFLPKKNACFADTDAQCFLAYRDGKIVGRIAGLIQHTYNKIHNVKNARFTRFDCIDDQEVANALFDAAIEWARENGMNAIQGPLGFNDLDREGLLTYGFDELSTFETQYNFPYYQKLIENYGFEKDCDYVEYKILIPKEANPRYERVANLIMKRYKLHVVQAKNKKEFVKKYYDAFFDLIDEAYSDLYGVVPFSPEARKQFTGSFNLIINLRYLCAVADENDKLVGFGLTFPSLAEGVRACNGKFLPFGWYKMLHHIKHPKICDLALIAVAKEYRNKGLPAMLFNKILNNFIEDGIEYCETNLNMEDNEEVQAQWKSFDHQQHKRRRCFIKHF